MPDRLLHGAWADVDTRGVRWPSRDERGMWAAAHPFWTSLLMATAVFIGMVLLPSIREPRLLKTPLWLVIATVDGIASGPVIVLLLRRKYRS